MGDAQMMLYRKEKEKKKKKKRKRKEKENKAKELSNRLLPTLLQLHLQRHDMCASCASGHPLGCLMSHACQQFYKIVDRSIALYSARKEVEPFEGSR